MPHSAESHRIEFPAKLQGLFEPHRYKVLYGGRGGAKSWAMARALLLRAIVRPQRVLCGREFQRSIQDSVHRLLADQIEALGLTGFYDVQRQVIQGRNGSSFVFAGLRHNVASIKSFEGIDICWVEEAQSVTRASWEVLTPTIRKPGSEIWVSFNPELESDETYRRFVREPPPDAWVRKINWSDNPWFPETLHAEMAHLKTTDYDAWLTTWEGHCRQALAGAVYAAELRAATESGRIGTVPHDPERPVHTFWDLGWADSTAIWFAQAVGGEFRVVDYLEDRQKPLGHYVEALAARGYGYGTDWLPHDAQARQLGTGRSVEELLRAAGRTVRIVPRLSLADGINALRTAFERFWFDAEKCADGLNCLRRYRYEVDAATGQFSRLPLHDDASHGADAARYMAVALREPVAARRRVPSMAR